MEGHDYRARAGGGGGPAPGLNGRPVVQAGVPYHDRRPGRLRPRFRPWPTLLEAVRRAAGGGGGGEEATRKMWGGDGGLLPETASRFFITVLMRNACVGTVFVVVYAVMGLTRSASRGNLVCGRGIAEDCLRQTWRIASERGSAYVARACRTSRRRGICDARAGSKRGRHETVKSAADQTAV